MLVETGRAQPHHVLPHTGWVSKQIRDEDDVRDVIELFRLGYERALVARERDVRSDEALRRRRSRRRSRSRSDGA